ncbi:MAG: hypothetical protein JRF02_00220 [Deltaproteobacteria bacterium]|jgi:hypothetical protein|nr:hypothetical protein [Deltaproteobacteria bacterium]
MIQHSQSATIPLTNMQEIDLVTLHPCRNNNNKMITTARETISQVLHEFLGQKEFSLDRISVIDGFLFVFNDQKFSQWHSLKWWEQRKRIRTTKDHSSYMERAYSLLQHSHLSSYIDYSDETVAKSDKPEVKHAWMRKRLVMKECFWNAIDSISHAAYYQKKYQDQFPALCVLLINIRRHDGRESELALGIDNGTGFLYKKKSRDSSLMRFLYKMYKLFFRSGVFYIGGLELGLQETDSELSFHGVGAVVYQGW